MADEPPQVVGIETLFDGFEQAFVRWQAVERATHEPLQTFMPLFEVLEWTACLDERMETKKWLTSPNLRGLRWARNRCHHDWALALEVRSWEEWKLPPHGVRQPGAPDEWTWRERLPEARPTRFRDDEPFYKNHLAGRSARVTLNLVHALFVQLRPEAE